MAILNKFGLDPAKLIGHAEYVDLWSRQAAQRMVTGRYYANARTWRQAARQSMRGEMIYEALQQELSGPVGARVRELVRENAKLISSVPSNVATLVAARAATQAQGGGRSTGLLADKLFSRIARVRVRLIARTEVSKASTALTQARSEELDLPWYIWRTSEDARVRLSHRRMDNVLFQWSQPPSPELLVGLKSQGRYAPGNIYNCRCYPEPLLTLTQIVWPHRVYWGNSIRPMTLAQFRSINHLPRHQERIGIAA